MYKKKSTENDLHFFCYENGILEVIVKDTPPTMELLDNSLSIIDSFSKNGKILLLMDARDAVALSSDQRSYVIGRFEHSIKALAVVKNNWLVILLHKFIMKIDEPTFPIKLVSNHQSGKDWLKNIL